jgi:hypothetical protein
MIGRGLAHALPVGALFWALALYASCAAVAQ